MKEILIKTNSTIQDALVKLQNSSCIFDSFQIKNILLGTIH